MYVRAADSGNQSNKTTTEGYTDTDNRRRINATNRG
jgi:hypothetical protein